MAITKLDYCITRGDTGGFRMVVTNLSDIPVNTDNYKLYFTAKKGFDDITLIDPIEAIVVDTENGIYVIPIPSSITEELPVGTFSYDIQLNDINGMKKTIFNGCFEVLPEYTTGV